jgi:hypothetical protein
MHTPSRALYKRKAKLGYFVAIVEDLQVGGHGEFFLIIDSIRFGRSAEPYQSSLCVLASSVCLVGCFVLFCFPLKDGEKSSLECQFFLFLQVFV